MEGIITELITATLPDNLKEQGKQLTESSKRSEEERLKGRNRAPRRYKSGGYEGRDEDSEEARLKRKRMAEEAAVPIAVARLVTELWCSKMRHYAEILILNKAVQEGYIKQKHLQWIHVFDTTNKVYGENEWIIKNVDDTIIELIWEKFNIKEHFCQVSSHRMWVQRSYDRLKEFMPSLHPEIIERHDLSKFAFSQAIGYCLKWVHNINHDIWTVACELHLQHEPHHPQCWNNAHEVKDKKKKLENWLKDACDFGSGCPYGLELATLDLSSGEMAEPFLLESFVDMVGIEWERKKNQQLDITTRHLVYMDDKFLNRYSKMQHQLVSELMGKIMASDDSWKNIPISRRDKMLLSIVPEHKHAVFVTQHEAQKGYEEKRLTRLSQKHSEEQSSETKTGMSQEMIDKASDNAFFIMLGKVVIELWDASLRKHANTVVLKKAIEDKIINSHYVDWIMVLDKQEEQSEGLSSPNVDIDDGNLIKLLWEDFKLKEHFSAVQVHRHWIRQSYHRLAKFMPEITEEIIERHDLTKFALSQSIGYTLKWIHDLNYPIWRKACNNHLNYEPHHPQLWGNAHTPEQKKLCLETWLCFQDDKKYGFDLNSLDLTTENMARVFLVESLLDMVAVEWERNKNQKMDLTYTELIYMEDRFLARYSDHDRAFVEGLMMKIRTADEQ